MDRVKTLSRRSGNFIESLLINEEMVPCSNTNWTRTIGRPFESLSWGKQFFLSTFMHHVPILKGNRCSRAVYFYRNTTDPCLLDGTSAVLKNRKIDRSFVSKPGRHYHLELQRLLGLTQLSDVHDDEMEIAEDEGDVPAFQEASHTYFYTLPGGGWASSRLDKWYVSYRHADWIRDVAMSVPGPAAD